MISVPRRCAATCSATPASRSQADLEVTGPIKVVLYAATDGLDTDWTAKLVDVSPTGYAKNLCDGIIRARYRETVQPTGPLTPDQVYEYEIDRTLPAMSSAQDHRIRRGHLLVQLPALRPQPQHRSSDRDG